MFPHPCGEALRKLVESGADPRSVVPGEYFVVKGGVKPPPPPGTEFSCTCGPDLAAAACGVPHNQIQFTTVASIRVLGGEVIWVSEYSSRGTLNEQHVNILEKYQSSFSGPVPNPVVKRDRIDNGQ